MTNHVIQPNTPISDPRSRCGAALLKCSQGDFLVAESAVDQIDCVGCLRSMVFDLRLEANGFGDDEAARWFAGSDTGTSSKTIWSVMTGRRVDRVDIPYDADDFGRCHRLLEQFSSWRDRLAEVAEKYPAWAPLVAAWDELTSLYQREREDAWPNRGALMERIDELRGVKRP